MYALEIKQLQKIYKNGVKALNGIDLTVRTGDFFALLGANGAGKSTTIGLITMLVTKSSGMIKVCGHNIDKNPEKAKACIGVVPQEFNLNIFETCLDILLNQAGYYGIPRKRALPHIEYLLHQLALWDKRHSIVRQLSGGMKRRLMIARGLVHQPQLLILDEPTAGVDIEIRRSVWDFLTRLNEQGTTIILTTHYLEEAENLCKNIAIIDKGYIVKNTSMHDLLQSQQHQTFIFTTINPIHALTNLEAFNAIQLDQHTLELRIGNHDKLNDVFAMFTQQGIYVSSMRNKTNRLEELFLDMIHHDD
ncbi:MAG: ABC transporter ATP-binding protein [Legionella sp.]